MRKITSKGAAFALALLAMFICVPFASAENYPALTELYGRYVFSGTMTSMAEESGEEALEPVARTGYTMVIVPGTVENEVQMLGFFGYGGGLKATYNQETGVLHCAQNAFFICANMGTTGGMMVVVDGGVGKTLDLNFQVDVRDGQPVITAAEGFTATAMNNKYEGDKWTYAAGYTMTRQDVTVSVADAAGTYEFESDNVISTMVDGVYEFFDLKVKDKGNGKVIVSGLFDIAEDIEADYQPEGGVLVLPYDHVFANGMFMGDNIEYVQFRREPAPWLLFDGKTVTTPSSFLLCSGYDETIGNPILFSFQGGEGTKTQGGDGVDAVTTDDGLTVVTGEATITVNASVPTVIKIYDAAGTQRGAAYASSAEFGGLTPGVYVVKAGGKTLKAILK